MKKSIVALSVGTALLLSGCVGYPDRDKDITIQILDRDSKVVKEIKVDDYEKEGDDTRYQIGKKIYLLQGVPHIIVGEVSDEDDD